MYRNNIFSNNVLNGYLSKPNTMFIKENTLQGVLEKQRFSQPDIDNLLMISKLQRYALENFEYNFIINPVSFFNSLLARETCLGVHTLKFKKKEFEKYLEELAEGILANDNINYYLVNKDYKVEGNWDYPLSIFASDDTLVIKKPKYFSNYKEFKYVIVNNQMLRDIVIDSLYGKGNKNFILPIERDQLVENMQKSLRAMEIAERS